MKCKCHTSHWNFAIVQWVADEICETFDQSDEEAWPDQHFDNFDIFDNVNNFEGKIDNFEGKNWIFFYNLDNFWLFWNCWHFFLTILTIFDHLDNFYHLDNCKDDPGDWDCLSETLIKMLTIENLNSWQSLHTNQKVEENKPAYE